MRSLIGTRSDAVLIGIVAAVSFLLALGNSHFWEQDEGFYAATALEMHQRNDWIVPTFNHELFAHKPPLMFWGIRAGYLLCGIGETGARLFSALAGVGTCILVYFLASRLFDRWIGLIAGLALATNIMFCVVARSATADAYLTLFVTASLAFWFLPYNDLLRRSAETATKPSFDQLPAWAWLGSYACMGLAVLTKGPIGFLFPVTILAASIWSESVWIGCGAQPQTPGAEPCGKPLWQRAIRGLHPLFIFKLLRAIRLHWGLLVVLFVAAPWFWIVDLRSGGDYMREFIGVHHLGRFSNAMDNHSGPPYYYLLACLAGFYPWSGFAIPIVLCWFGRMRRATERDAESVAMLWLSLWFCVYLVVFSLAQTKLPNYVLPAYPAMAIATGCYWRETARNPNAWYRWQRIGYLCNLGIGVAIGLAPFALSQLRTRLPTDQQDLLLHLEAIGLLSSISLAGIPLVLVSLLGLLWKSDLRGEEPIQGPNHPMAFAYGAAALLFVTHLSLVVAPKADRLQSPQILAERSRFLLQKSLPKEIGDASPPALPLSVVSMFRPTLVYYAGGKVQFIGRERFVQAAWESERNGELRYWMVQQKDWETYSPELPQSFRVIDSALDFPKPGDLLLVSNASAEGVDLRPPN